MNDDNNIDLLDLDDTDTDTLPAATAFATPRPRRPWLLLGVGLLVIVLATYVIIRTIGGDSASSVDVDLDTPTDTVEIPTPDFVPPSDSVMPPAVPVQPAPQPVPGPGAQPVAAQPVPPAPAPVAQPEPKSANVGSPVRVIEDRKDVEFNPNRADVKPAPAPKPQQTVKPRAPQKTVNKSTVARGASWYVQFGSYSTRSAAEAAQRKMQSEHSSLFSGHQFVILAAQLKNGTTTYRLRVAFNDSASANSFCRNAKSDGLDCYVAK